LSPSPRSPDGAHLNDRPDPEGFWIFAVAAWGQSELREQLLRWQDVHGIDVIFLLFACWLPHPLAPHRWGRLRTGSRQWHNTVTRRIRSLRRRIGKIDWPQGYQGALALELASERIEATWLAHAAGAPRGPLVPPDLAGRLKRLFPDLPPAERTVLLAAIGSLR
jgi:uncharacterized protein (TIGR02444 family)